MVELVKKYLTPPQFPDEIKSQKAAMLHILLWSNIGFQLIYLLIFIFTAQNMSFDSFGSGLFFVWAVVTLGLVRRGWEQWASWQFSLLGWGLITLMIMTHGIGFISPLFGAYIILSLASGLLLGRRSGLVVAALSMATSAWLIYADRVGLLPPPTEPMTPFLAWFVLAALFILAGIVLHLAVSNLTQALARARQTEQALRASEMRYRVISEMTSDYAYAFHFDPQGRPILEWMSEAVTRITGYTQLEFNQLGWSRLIHPDDIPAIQNQLDLLRSGQPATSVNRIITKGGEIRWIQTYSRPIWDASQSRVLGFHGASQDITERKQTVEKLQQSEKKAHSLLRLAKLLEQAVTYDQILTALFAELPPILGYYHLWLYLISADGESAVLVAERHSGAEQIHDQLRYMAISGDSYLEEIARADHIVVVDDATTDPRTNQERAALNQCRTLVNVPLLLDKQRIGVIGMGTFGEEGVKGLDPGQLDYLNAVANHVVVTLNRVQFLAEREQMTTALQASHELFKNTLLSAPISMILADLKGRFWQVNEATCNLLGYSETELLALDFTAITHPDDIAISVEYVNRALAGEFDRYQHEKRYLHRDGHEIWAVTNINLVRDAERQPEYFIGQIQDITQRKQADAALKQRETELSLALHDKKILLQEIHHRVKNNLQVISSLLDLQAKYLKDEASREVFKESQHRIRSMALVHERLYQAQDLTRIDYAEYITNLTHHLLVAYDNRRRQIHLRQQIDPLSLSIETAIPCGLIINELVSNALKHAFPDHSGGEIWLEFRAAPNSQIILRVGDNGIGLPPQVDFRRSKSLGLTLVTTLVKQLQGTIEVNNNTRGTEFCISFSDAKITEEMSKSA